jgi:hypothetical protein
MSTRTDALLSQRETGKITASIIPIAADCHSAHEVKPPNAKSFHLKSGWQRLVLCNGHAELSQALNSCSRRRSSV